jgi:hypothetical protein
VFVQAFLSRGHGSIIKLSDDNLWGCGKGAG